MKRFSWIFLAAMIFTCTTSALADGFKMDKISLTTKQIEGEDAQNWLYFNSNAKYDWLSMNLYGKLYFPQLDEKYEDTSIDGMGDLYSGVRAILRFPGLSKGLKGMLGYKWNQDYEIFSGGLGFGWKMIKYMNMGIWVDGSDREALSQENNGNNYQRLKEEFTLNYAPPKWDYDLTFTRSDYSYPNAKGGPDPNNPQFNDDYSALSYTLDQKLTYQASARLSMGLGYRTYTTDYYKDQARKKDGEGNKLTLEGNYIQNKYWTWDGGYAISHSDGYNGTADINSFSLNAKYTSYRNWWLTSKLRLYDLDYSDIYTTSHEDPDEKDKDADYHSRQQQVIAVEYKQKLPAFTYAVEPFVKNYDYVLEPVNQNDPKDNTELGVIGTLEWRWMDLNWYFLAAPSGTLTTRKGLYMLRAEYKFK